MAEDRVWSAETERVRFTDPLGPVWRAVVIPDVGRSTAAPASELAARLGSIGVDVVFADDPLAQPDTGIDLVCSVDPDESLVGRRLAFELDAPVLEFPSVPDRPQLIRAIEHRRVRREPALEYRTAKASGFAVNRIDIEAASGLDVELGDPAAPTAVHRADRIAVQPATPEHPGRMRSQFRMTAALADEERATLEENQAARIRTCSLTSLSATVDGAHVLESADTVVVSVHPRARLVCC